MYGKFNVGKAGMPSLVLAMSLVGYTGAASANQVTLLSNDGETRVGGELLNFDGKFFELKTMFGTINAPADAVQCEGTGCPVKQVSTAWGEAKIGEAVSISVENGSVKLGGVMKSFADGQAMISTQIGDFNISLDEAECTGPGCPELVETVAFVIPGGDGVPTNVQLASAGATDAVEPVQPTAQAAEEVDHSAHVGHGDHTDAKISDTFYPDTGLETPYEVEPEIRLAGPGEIVEVMMPVALENYAWRHNGVLDLFDDHMTTTEDIGELKHHAAGVGFEVKDNSGERILGLLGHHAHDPNEQISMLANGATDVAFVTGPVSAAEKAIMRDAGQGSLDANAQQRVVAMDGYVAIVSPVNPLSKIALEDLQKVFAGQITNWSQLGGDDAPINLYTYRTGHETFLKTRDVLLQPAGLTISPDAKEHRLTRQIIDSVMTDVNGIGFVSYARRRGAKPLSLVMECGIEIDANPLTIKTERYPLVQRIAAFTRPGEQKPLVDDFLQFIESTDFDAGVEKAGFVSLNVEATSLLQDAQSFAVQVVGYTNPTEINRARAVLSFMDGRSSLTAAFRFLIDSADLDQRAERDLKRVVKFISENPDAQYSVVGFADSTGGFPQNEVLSLRRAQAVIEALRRTDTDGKIGSVKLQAIGGGELNAVACNETEAERATNRRVEIWMKR